MQSDRPRGNRRSARGGRPRQAHREAQEGEQEEEWPLPVVVVVVVVRRGALARLEEFPERVILLGVPILQPPSTFSTNSSSPRSQSSIYVSSG